MRLAVWLSGLLVLTGLAGGCGRPAPPEFRTNEVEWLKQERQTLKDGESFPASYRQQVSAVLSALFGTPDQPRFLFVEGEEDPGHKVLSMENLRLAAGPVNSDRKDTPSGLYREHCAHCHGITGDGAGPTAGMLNPYPRDFRLGKFKFKSTPLRSPPTDADLEHILRQGIPGTGMPSFATLPTEHITALVQYVKYLSIRGVTERRLIEQVPQLEGEPLVDLELLAAAEPWFLGKAEAREPDDSLLDLLEPAFVEQSLGYWLQPERKVTRVPPPIPAVDVRDPGHADLVRQGQILFRGKANCVQCHGETGLGDGQTGNHDDWTNEWMKAPGVQVNDPATWKPFLELGALPPRPIRPRNLNLPVYRGGGSPEELFLRVRNGIEGTPMPSSPILNDDEVWAVVAWIRSMPYPESAATPAPAVASSDRSRSVGRQNLPAVETGRAVDSSATPLHRRPIQTDRDSLPPTGRVVRSAEN